MFFLQQNQRTRGWNRFCPEAGRGRGKELGRPRQEVAQIMYTHVSKCKNDKIKKKNLLLHTSESLLYWHSEWEDIITAW
jgi:hypothetical protein